MNLTRQDLSIVELAEDKIINKLNPNSIISILALRYDVTQKSLLQKLTWKDFVTKNSKPSLDYIENQILNNISHNLKDAKHVTIALSGGIDSTLILALIRKTLPDITINAISIKFSQSDDESKIAKKIAEKFESNHKVVYVENYFQELPNAIKTIKSPFWDIHWYYVAKATKSSKFLVSGDGGDEIFGGYTFRYKNFLDLTTLNASPLKKIKNYLKCHERDHVSDQNKLFGKKIPFSWKKVYNQLMPFFNNTLDPLQQVFLADYNGKLLHNFSLINSRITKKFNLTSITPLLSNELITYATHLDPLSKYDASKNLGKLPLRNLLKNIAPDLKISVEKKGFSINTQTFWKSYGKQLSKEFLLNSEIVNEGYINQQWISKYIDKNDLSIPIINKFLGLLSFEIWHRIFITKNFQYSQL